MPEVEFDNSAYIETTLFRVFGGLGIFLDFICGIFLLHELRNPKSPLRSAYFILLTIGLGVIIASVTIRFMFVFDQTSSEITWKAVFASTSQWYSQNSLGIWILFLGLNRCTAITSPRLHAKIWAPFPTVCVIFSITVFPFVLNGYYWFNRECRFIPKLRTNKWTNEQVDERTFIEQKRDRRTFGQVDIFVRPKHSPCSSMAPASFTVLLMTEEGAQECFIDERTIDSARRSIFVERAVDVFSRFLQIDETRYDRWVKKILLDNESGIVINDRLVPILANCTYMVMFVPKEQLEEQGILLTQEPSQLESREEYPSFDYQDVRIQSVEPPEEPDSNDQEEQKVEQQFRSAFNQEVSFNGWSVLSRFQPIEWKKRLLNACFPDTERPWSDIAVDRKKVQRRLIDFMMEKKSVGFLDEEQVFEFLESMSNAWSTDYFRNSKRGIWTAISLRFRRAKKDKDYVDTKYINHAKGNPKMEDVLEVSSKIRETDPSKSKKILEIYENSAALLEQWIENQVRTSENNESAVNGILKLFPSLTEDVDYFQPILNQFIKTKVTNYGFEAFLEENCINILLAARRNKLVNFDPNDLERSEGKYLDIKASTLLVKLLQFHLKTQKNQKREINYNYPVWDYRPGKLEELTSSDVMKYPFVAVVNDVNQDVSYHVVLYSNVLKSKTLSKAINALLSVYRIFSIAYPPEAVQVFNFYCKIMNLKHRGCVAFDELLVDLSSFKSKIPGSSRIEESEGSSTSLHSKDPTSTVNPLEALKMEISRVKEEYPRNSEFDADRGSSSGSGPVREEPQSTEVTSRYPKRPRLC